MPDREPILIVKPPKPVSEMTDAEYEAWVDAVADRMADGLHGPGPDQPSSSGDSSVSNP